MSGPCPGKKADGKRCKSKPRKGRKWCWFHDPESKEARATAQANGGAESRNRVGPAKVLGKKAPDVDVSSEGAIRALMSETIDQVRRGELSTHAAQVVGQLAGQVLKALKQDVTDEKVNDLDRRTRVLEGMSKAELMEIARSGDVDPNPKQDEAEPN